MTDERIKELAYGPILEAWKIIHMTQNIGQDDNEKWREYVQAHDEFCKKKEPTPKQQEYRRYLAMAIMEIVDQIAKENSGDD